METKHVPAMEREVERIIATYTNEWGIKTGEIARACYVAGFHAGYLEAVDDDALGQGMRKIKP